MARCGCSGTTCSCKIIGGGGVTVSGAGSVDNPYVISTGGLSLVVSDTSTLDLTLVGSGTVGDPYQLSGAMAAISMMNLSNVSPVSPTDGQVLIWNNTTGKWTPGPAATATPGLITVGNGLSGDGSAGNPLNTKPNPGGRLVNTAGGIDMSTDTSNRLVNSFANTAARTAAIPSPGSGMTAFMVDTQTPVMHDGTTWRPFYLEVGRTWVFPRVSAGVATVYGQGTLVMASGSIASAMSGRYQIDATTLIGSAEPLNGLSEVLAGASVIRAVNRDTTRGYFPVTDSFIYVHAGGTLALSMRHTNNYNAQAEVLRDGTQLLVKYLGRV